jgi:hypothetical protein
VRHAFLVILVLVGMASSVRAASAPSPPLLALTGGGLGSTSRLVALEPRTLEPRARRVLSLPGWAFGREWARSPDDGRIALVPKPSETHERLFVISTLGSLRVLARLPLPGEDACRLVWPSARRLLLVLTRGAACYTTFDSPRVLVVDPLRARAVAQHPLSARAMVIASARTRAGLAPLLASPARLSGARLVLVGAAGTGEIPLPSLHTQPRALDKSIMAGAVGLAIDRRGGRAYIVEPGGRVMDVDLASGRVSVRALRLRKPAAAAKGTTGPVVQALWLGRGFLAITGVRPGPSGRLVPLGLRILDTRSWRSRLIDADATGVAHAGTTTLAFQPFFEQLGPRATAIGLRAYSRDGALRFHAFPGQAITTARLHGRYAYLAGEAAGGIVDLSNGHELSGSGALSISPFELLADPS